MTTQQSWSELIAEIITTDLNNLNIPEIQKEMRRKFIDATKELFVNQDEKKAVVHFSNLLNLIQSQNNNNLNV